MPIRFLPDQPASRPVFSLHEVMKRLPSLLSEIRAARAARLKVKEEHAAIQRRNMERYQIGFASLGVSIRNTTGNHGRPGPRR